MPETDSQTTNTSQPSAAEPGLPATSEVARADGFRRQADVPPPHGPGLLTDVFEELNATVEELRVAEEEMRVQNEELLLTRQRVEAERHRYQDLFEFAPDGYLVTALDGRILEANRTASSLLGIAPRFLKGRGLGSSVAPEDLTAFSAALRALAASPTPAYPQERSLRLRRRHGGLFHAAVTVTPVAPLGKQPATLRWLVRDVTERRQAEEERLAFARAQAAPADQERERRMADVLRSLLLHTAPADAFPRLSIETFSASAPDEAETGGFFDAFALDEGRVALVVGDSGRSPIAAVRAAEVKYALRVLLRQEGRPVPALARLNDFVCEAQRLGDFGPARPVALALAVVDTGTGEAALATAGGGPLLLLRARGGVETFETGGPAFGLQPGASYAESQATLGAGDTLLITGGLTGAAPDTLARLVELAEAAHGADTLRGMGQALLDSAQASDGGTSGDDACLLLARRRA